MDKMAIIMATMKIGFGLIGLITVLTVVTFLIIDKLSCKRCLVKVNIEK
ncbi:hypothetical protein [Lachnospira sp.]|jgi:hypothetical protein|nr:hypothetical protein [Lachnospira sp.]